MQVNRNDGDEIPIYASIPYETTEINEFQPVNNQTPSFQTISLRANYNQKTVLINLIKQKLINLLQAIEMTNVNTPIYEPAPRSVMRRPSCKMTLLIIIFICQMTTFFLIVIFCAK